MVNSDPNKDWTVKATFNRDGFKNSNWFTGKPDTPLPRGLTSHYELKFRPEWIDTAECEL